MSFEHREYEGRTAVIELPELGRAVPFNKIMIRQGVNQDLLRELSSAPSLFADDMSNRIDQRLSDSGVTIESDGPRTTLTYGDMLFSEITLKRTE
jgi:hypothetical protein